MSARDLVYVGHMLDMARKAVVKTRGLSREAYDADENLRLALIHLIQVTGEAARQVSPEFSGTPPEIPWEWSRRWGLLRNERYREHRRDERQNGPA